MKFTNFLYFINFSGSPLPFTFGSEDNSWSKNQRGVTIDYIMGQSKNAVLEFNNVRVTDLKNEDDISLSDHNAVMGTVQKLY